MVMSLCSFLVSCRVPSSCFDVFLVTVDEKNNEKRRYKGLDRHVCDLARRRSPTPRWVSWFWTWNI